VDKTFRRYNDDILPKKYVKPVNENKLLAHMKRTIVTKDRATKKRKEKQSQSLPSDELLEKVRNNSIYKGFMKLETGEKKFYDSRNSVRGDATDLIKLMNQISNRMNCNKKYCKKMKKLLWGIAWM
jgi:hypothetical protein